MSPFSKYLAKLSPLVSKDQFSSKRQKLYSCSKFSVENMKSPEGDKIKFNIDDIMNANDTPTFNSHCLESANLDFPFLDDKENINTNRQFPGKEEELPLAKDDKSPINRDTEEGQSLFQNNTRIQRILAPKYLKSRGSTSPDSFGKAKCDVTLTNKSNMRNNSLSDSRFQITKVKVCSKREELKNSGEIVHKTPENKKRVTKAKTKKIMISKLSSASSEKAKGCTCKKSMCKKLYCE